MLMSNSRSLERAIESLQLTALVALPEAPRWISVNSRLNSRLRQTLENTNAASGETRGV